MVPRNHSAFADYARCSSCHCTKPLERFRSATKAAVLRACDACREKARARKAANREHHAALTRASYERNRERANARSRAYYAANTDRAKAAMKAWVAEHPDEHRAIQHNARARRRNAPGTITADDVALLREMSCGLCAYCLRPGLKLSVEHVAALAAGGTNDLGNLVMACRPCNSRKGSRGILTMVQHIYCEAA